MVRRWGPPWTSAVTLPHGRNGLRAWRMAVLSMFREPSLCRQVHRELLRSALLDLLPIISATACHQRNYVERYSRSMCSGKVPQSYLVVAAYGKLYAMAMWMKRVWYVLAMPGWAHLLLVAIACLTHPRQSPSPRPLCSRHARRHNAAAPHWPRHQTRARLARGRAPTLAQRSHNCATHRVRYSETPCLHYR